MVMPSPIRSEHQIAGLHQHFFAFDVGVACAVSLDDMIDGTAGVALRLRGRARWNELHPATDGWHSRPAAQRMGVFQQYAVMGIDLARAGRLFQSVQCVLPFIGIG